MYILRSQNPSDKFARDMLQHKQETGIQNNSNPKDLEK